MKKIIAIIVATAVLFSVLGTTSSISAAKYKGTVNYKRKVRIGKTTYKLKYSGGRNRIVRIRNGRKKTILKGFTGDSFVTNGKYIFYNTGRGSNDLGLNQNRIYRYNIKKKSKRYILKIKKDYCARPIAKRGKYLFYEKTQEVSRWFYVYNLKTHKKKKLMYMDYGGFKIKGNRVYITEHPVEADATYYSYIFTLSGKKLGKVYAGRT